MTADREVPPEYLKAGSLPTNLSLKVIQELNRRGIGFRLVETDAHNSTLHVEPHSVREAEEVVEEIKRKNPRVRL